MGLLLLLWILTAVLFSFKYKKTKDVEPISATSLSGNDLDLDHREGTNKNLLIFYENLNTHKKVQNLPRKEATLKYKRGFKIPN